MIITKNSRLNEEFMTVNHKSGLTILMYPMKGYSSSYALFGTKFGSIDNSFIKDGEKVLVPDGTAHFLEHKMFEGEDGDAFELFAKTGASANAFTSFDKTCYLFSTTDNFKESLTSLLSFVSSPYFTEETVKKEQGIIGQEIRMYDDNPHWRVFFNLLTALYVNHPVRKDIAGTVESISQINEKILYSLYNTFYNLNNMVLAVSGNFDPNEVIETADSVLEKASPHSIEREEEYEPEEIKSDFVSQNLVVSVPLFAAGYKEKPASGKELVKNEVMSGLIVELLAGEGSPLYRSLYDEGLINSSFGTEVMTARGCFAEIFEGESKDPKQVFERIKAEAQKKKSEGITPGEFERVKKLFYGRMVRRFSDVESVANMLVNSHFADTGVYDTIEAAAQITLDELNAYLERTFNADKMALSVIYPKE